MCQLWSLSFIRQTSISLFLLTLIIHALPTISNPLNNLHPKFEDPQPLSELAHAPFTSNPPTDSTPPLSKRGPVTHYRNLGVWRMILTASSLFYSPNAPLQPASSTIASFLSTVMADASANVARRATQTAVVEFGLGAISLAFRVRDGAGSSATVPWTLILQLAQEFEQRALRGDPTSFRAAVQGPLGVNSWGGEPWIEVVLVVAGKEVMDGFPWSVY